MSHTQGSLKQKKVVLKPTDVISNIRRLDENGNEFDVNLDDIILRVRYQSGYEIEKDVSCNYQYMLEVMPKAGKMMREAYLWIPKGTKNASGDWVGGQPI